ncbi:MAG: MMPL family transporter [Legionella sp.]|jgi:RND superfamily putative drug exporter
MRKGIFYRLGQWIHILRWPIIGVWLLVLLSCLPFLPHIISPFKTTGFIDEESASAATEKRIDKQFGYNKKNTFMVLYHSKTLTSENPLFLKKIKNSLKNLKNFPIKHEIIYPQDEQQISKDKHTMTAVIIIKSKELLNAKLVTQLKSSIKKPANMTMELGGELIFVDSVNKQTESDLIRADYIATPMALITLIFVFGSLVAATLPIILGGGCAIIILTSLYFIGHFFTLSIFTLNIALLLGLCLCLDYCLFYISRFREELANGLSNGKAIAVTQANAGKSIFFSGLAVFVSLSALFFFPINILISVAFGGMVAVFFAVLMSMVLLPAILSLLNNKINSLSVRFWKTNNFRNYWQWFAEKVVLRPYLYFFPVLGILLLLGYPFLSVIFGVSDERIFPEHSPNRAFYNTYAKEFNIEELTPIVLMVESPDSPILSRDNLSSLSALVQEIKRNHSVKEVNSIVNTSANIPKDQYYALYHTPDKLMSPQIKQLLSTTTTKHVTIINVTSKYDSNAPQTQKLISALRTLKNRDHLMIHLAGVPVINKEVLHSIFNILPWAVLWVMGFTYIVLLILLRSIFLPFKAIVMNMLSLSACFGALVLVFQEGYFSSFLNFEPQGMLDISLLVIIFCALFGFSMDYEVFLLSRIKEFHNKTQDKLNCIIFGIVKSSRIITSAALIVVVLCCAFLVADVLMVKAFGLGIAIAIFVDAFLIRTLLVPSTMSIFKNWNWYLPKWLSKILPNVDH